MAQAEPTPTTIHRYHSPDINVCRDWLRLFEFDCDTRGWTRPDGALGQIQFWRGEWHAAYSETTDPRAAP